MSCAHQIRVSIQVRACTLNVYIFIYAFIYYSLIHCAYLLNAMTEDIILSFVENLPQSICCFYPLYPTLHFGFVSVCVCVAFHYDKNDYFSIYYLRFVVAPYRENYVWAPIRYDKSLANGLQNQCFQTNEWFSNGQHSFQYIRNDNNNNNNNTLDYFGSILQTNWFLKTQLLLRVRSNG